MNKKLFLFAIMAVPFLQIHAASDDMSHECQCAGLQLAGECQGYDSININNFLALHPEIKQNQQLFELEDVATRILELTTKKDTKDGFDLWGGPLFKGQNTTVVFLSRLSIGFIVLKGDINTVAKIILSIRACENIKQHIKEALKESFVNDPIPIPTNERTNE